MDTTHTSDHGNLVSLSHMKNVLLSIGVLLLLAGAWFFFTTGETVAPTETPEQTTQQEPTEEGPDTGMLTTTDPKSDITFTYPENLPTTYITAQEWPPRFVLNGGPFDCDIDEQTAAMSGFSGREQKMRGDVFCIWDRSEGAAGSVYRDYQIAFKKDDLTYIMSFTLREVECMNYPEAEAAACQRESEDFDVLALMYPIIQSVSAPTN